MEIALRARLPLIITVVAAVLLAVLTGASNQTPVGGAAPGPQVATGGRGPAGVFALSAATVDAVTAAPAVPDVATAAVGSAEGAGRAGDGAEGDAGDPEPAPEGDSPDPDPASAPARTGTRQAQPATVAAPEPEPVPAPASAPAPVAAVTRLPDVELEVLALTNVDRADNAVPPVSRDGCIDAEASAWAATMAGSQTMAHSGGAGGAVQGCRGSGAYWGDNIGYWQPCSASAMESWWMGSPSHRPHILDANFAVVGIGVWSEPSGRCWFQVYFGS